MRDRIVEFANRYRLVKVAGTDDIFDFVPVPGDVTDEGTPLNKANLLTDATAALYGKDSTATPETIFALLARAGLTPTSGNGLVDVRGNAIDLGGAKIQMGSYVGTGTYGSSNPCSLTFDFEPLMVFSQSVANVTGNLFTGNNYASGSDVYMGALPVYVLTTDYKGGSSASGFGFGRTVIGQTSPQSYAKKSGDGKTIYWYNTGSDIQQANRGGCTYYYFAIG